MKMNRIILAGGSGFCGRLLAEKFAADGVEVVVLTRTPKKRGQIRDVAWDAKNPGPWASELDGATAVINLTGRSVNCRYTAANRRLILDSRVLSTKVLGEAIAKCGEPPPVWLNAGTATIYKHSLDREMDETGEIGSDRDAKDEFSVEVAQAWETALNEAQTPRTRKIPMRMAMVFSPEQGTVFRVLRRLTRVGAGGTMAGGRQYTAWIHEDDYCRAVEWLIRNEKLTGPFNIVSPNPVTNRELMATFRRVVGMPIGVPATRWMMEIGAFIMRTETELMIKSRRVVPAKLLASGFHFNFPGLEEALTEIETRIVKG